MDFKNISSSQDQLRSLLSNLNTLRKNNQLCDVVLVADDKEIPCHRNVLAAASQYFYAMFTNELVESNSNRVVLQEVDGSALCNLIDFIYTCDIEIDAHNVQTLLPVSSLLLITEVTSRCCKFLQNQLVPSNCLGIYSFADLHSCFKLRDHALAFAEQNFLKIIKHDEYLTLSVDQLSNLVSSDALCVKQEEQVYEGVMSWVQYDVKNRRQYISQLMQNVRWQLLSHEFLDETVLNEPLVRSDASCKDLIIDAMRYHLVKSDESKLKGPRQRPRTPLSMNKVMLVIGGQAPKAIKSVERFDLKEQKWDRVHEMTSRRCRCGVAVLKGFVYAVGGFNGSLRVRTVDVYDPIRDRWAEVGSMNARRSTLGVAALNGYIYAVGGFDGSSGLNTVERYDPAKKEWSLVCSMNVRRSSVGVGVVNDRMYAVGGYDGMSRQCLSSVECYNPETDSWSLVNDMSNRRSGAGVGVVNGVLYAVGGHDGPLVKKSVEAYYPETDSWEPVVDMHLCRRNAGVVSHDGTLYVVGGDDGTANLPSIEALDTTHLRMESPNNSSSNGLVGFEGVHGPAKWSLINDGMHVGRSYAGVTVIDKRDLGGSSSGSSPDSSTSSYSSTTSSGSSVPGAAAEVFSISSNRNSRS